MAALLDRQADDIAARWEIQVRALLPEATDDAPGSSRVARAAAVVRCLAASLAVEGGASADAVALGLGFGTAAFSAGAMLHHLLRALELLEAMSLYAMEEAAERGEARTADLAQGVRLCRRLQQAASTVTLAAARGYAQAASGATQERFRRLRHDLRNPLSTIRSALELMADESVPEEARRGPRFRSMIERNATALDRMIVARLGDAEARSPAGAYQRIAPRTVAGAVRRDLRSDADAREVSVAIVGGDHPVRVDAAGLELLLHNVLLVALQEAGPGDVLTVAFPASDDSRASVTLTGAPGRSPIADRDARQRLATLASALGAWLEVERDHVALAFPVVPEESVPSASASLAGGEARDDVGRTREGDDRQARPL